MRTAAEKSGMLFAKDVAEARGISEDGARRFLRRLEEKYGKKVVGRIGNRRYITSDSLAAIGPNWAGKWQERCKILEERILLLEEKIESINARLDIMDERG